jgi:hypothetical protein
MQHVTDKRWGANPTTQLVTTLSHQLANRRAKEEAEVEKGVRSKLVRKTKEDGSLGAIVLTKKNTMVWMGPKAKVPPPRCSSVPNESDKRNPPDTILHCSASFPLQNRQRCTRSPYHGSAFGTPQSRALPWNSR